MEQAIKAKHALSSFHRRRNSCRYTLRVENQAGALIFEASNTAIFEVSYDAKAEVALEFLAFCEANEYGRAAETSAPRRRYQPVQHRAAASTALPQSRLGQLCASPSTHQLLHVITRRMSWSFEKCF